jgi:hypothetical protein
MMMMMMTAVAVNKSLIHGFFEEKFHKMVCNRPQHFPLGLGQRLAKGETRLPG